MLKVVQRAASSAAQSDLAPPLDTELLAICAHTEDLTTLCKTALRRGFTPIWVSELVAALDGDGTLPAYPVLICVDDGRAGMYSATLPSLVALDVKANFFLVSDFLTSGIGAVHSSLSSVGQQPITWAQAREMRDSGLIEFHNHTKTHQALTNFAEEFNACSDAIVDELGVARPSAIAWPNGAVTPTNAAAAADAGLRIGFDFASSSSGMTNRFSTLADGLFTLNRVVQLEESAFRFASQKTFVAHEHDWPDGRNYQNTLGFWLFNGSITPGGTQAFETDGVGVSIYAASKSVITADYFHVRPSDLLQFKGRVSADNVSAGTAGVRIRQYDVSLQALDHIDLATYTASTVGYENKAQDVALDPACRFVRLEVWTDASFSGQVRLRYQTLRVY